MGAAGSVIFDPLMSLDDQSFGWFDPASGLWTLTLTQADRVDLRQHVKPQATNQLSHSNRFVTWTWPVWLTNSVVNGTMMKNLTKEAILSGVAILFWSQTYKRIPKPYFGAHSKHVQSYRLIDDPVVFQPNLCS